MNQGIQVFLFSPVDARWLAWLRILVAVCFPFFFWSVGMKPAAYVPEILHPFYEHVVFTPGHKLAVLGLCGLLALGYRPRLVCCVLLVLFLPLAFLNRGIVSRPLLILVLTLFAFMPSGTVRFPWNREIREGFMAAGPCWPVRLMQIQLSIIYGINALAKSSESYLRGDILMDMSVSYANFLVDFSSGYWVLGPLAIPVSLAAVGSVVSEYVLAMGFWIRRLRWLVAVFGILFHFVLTHIVAIYMLDYVSIFLYLTFLLPLIRREQRSCGP